MKKMPGAKTGAFRNNQPGTSSVVAIDPLAPLVTLLRFDRQRGDRTRLEPLAARSARRFPRNSRRCRRRCGCSAASILAISLRWRSRARSSMARSVSEEARSARSGWFWFSSCRCCRVSLASLRMSSRQIEQLLAEIFPLPLVHERLFFGRPVVLVLGQRPAAVAVLPCASVLVVAMTRAPRSISPRGWLIARGPAPTDNIRVAGRALRARCLTVQEYGSRFEKRSRAGLAPTRSDAGLGDFDLDPQLDLGEHRVESGIAGAAREGRRWPT